MNLKFVFSTLALFVCTCSPLLSQVDTCHSVSFAASVSGTETFAREIGGGLWFTVFSDTIYPGGGWTMRIGEGQNPKERLDIGWALNRAWIADWELGPTQGRDADTAMKASPRQLWFALSKSDLKRLREAQYRQTSNDSRVAFTGEIDPGKLIAEIPKGLVSVSIVEYRLSEADKNRGLASVALRVTIVVPGSFPLLNSVPASCPSFPFSAQDTATW